MPWVEAQAAAVGRARGPCCGARDVAGRGAGWVVKSHGHHGCKWEEVVLLTLWLPSGHPPGASRSAPYQCLIAVGEALESSLYFCFLVCTVGGLDIKILT